MSILNSLFSKKKNTQISSTFPLKKEEVKQEVSTNKLEAPLVAPKKRDLDLPVLGTENLVEKFEKEQVDTKLKKEVKSIIELYDEKEKEYLNPTTTPVVAYEIKSKPQAEQEVKEEKVEQPQDEKEIIFKQITEVQKKIKTLKERTEEIEKEKVDLVKKEKELYSELTEEERSIQKLRDLDLPKEYLKLLEKLDRLTANNSQINKMA